MRQMFALFLSLALVLSLAVPAASANAAPDNQNRKDNLHVQVVLFDGFDLLDALAPYEVFAAAGMYSGDKVTAEPSLEGEANVLNQHDQTGHER